ncbi:HCL635Wp [Eremothecium sinecaudum]|uniref:non-specific serine/threonine protein kinase n=1 Tax=Eremothecium sinecaudum TaxID=45286 RepID=A0A120K1M8_9SACH|nr:HCL635Wp [Eremothecium sinecaudum]AMD19516.1 HCL635Wp [Eremothecium sinecaudum]
MMVKNQNVASSPRGDKIGPWKLGDTLGSGSTGKVLMAENEQTGQKAAMKVISKSVFNAQGSTFVGSNDPDVLPYGIEREIIIMKLLNHPNVLRLYDVWETSSDLYMVLEYVEKGELFNLLVERGPLPENEAVRFFRQIIIGISYCHALGIVHRDLKPENLLLDHKYNIKLADFGMAALESKDKLLETSCGSPHYAAPEIVSGLPYHGFESDVWSCGVILFALLTGRLPFDEEDGNIRNLLLKVQSGKFEMPGDDEISPEAQNLIGAILTVDPEKRIKTREILKHPLLQKYPSIKDSKSIRNLPREDTYLNPLDYNDGTIDQTILQNLVVLWHGRDKDEIIAKLKESGANLEKTFYALLHQFKHENQQEQLRQQQLAKIASSDSSPQRNLVRSASRRSVAYIPTTPRKKRTSVINVSSAHKRPVSLQKVNHNNNIFNGTSPVKRRSISNKRLSAICSSSTTSSPSNIRMSIQQEAPPVPKSVLRDYNKRASRNSRRLSFMPRGSITTKIIATYAKLSEEDDWEYIDREAKRTSSDFATLIDSIFEHDKYEQIRKEKEELERKVREAKEREEEERREKQREEERRRKEEEERRRLEQENELAKQRELQKTLEEEVARLRAEIAASSVPSKDSQTQKNTQTRSVSEPLANADLGNEQGSSPKIRKENVPSLSRNTVINVETRPLSKLDPGLIGPAIVSHVGDEITSERNDYELDKTILETIRRSNFLGSQFDINRELRKSRHSKIEAVNRRWYSEEKAHGIHDDKRLVSDGTTLNSYDGSNSAYAPRNGTSIGFLKDEENVPTKLSDLKIPEFTRRSKHFTASNKRLSVLSLYSSKASYTNLADYARGEDQLKTLSGAKINEEPEFMFESTTKDLSGNEADHNPGNEEPETNIRASYADRFNEDVRKTSGPTISDTQGEDGHDAVQKLKLPALPPLDERTKAGTGLGIYQKNKNAKSQTAQKSNVHDEAKESTSDNDPHNSTSKTAPRSPTESEHSANGKGKLNVSKRGSEARKTLNDASNKEGRKRTPFFRKFSREKPKDQFDYKLETIVNDAKMFRALDKLIHGWTSYGLKGVSSNVVDFVISGKLANDNLLSLRSTAFEISVVPSENNGSIVRFSKNSGSKKAFFRLTNEVEKILEKEDVLTTRPLKG